MKKNREIIVSIFNDEYKVVVCWGNPKEIAKVMKSWHYPKQDVKSSLLDRRGVCFYHKDCHPIIALPNKPKTAQEIGTLAHEAVHAINNIFDKIQAIKDDELFAHSVGAVVRKVLNR